MFVIYKEKGEEGYSLRPAYIGFIKNNKLRRTMMILFIPLVLLVSLTLNILQLCVYLTLISIRSLYDISKSLFRSIINIKPNILKYWDEPRTK